MVGTGIQLFLLVAAVQTPQQPASAPSAASQPADLQDVTVKLKILRPLRLVRPRGYDADDSVMLAGKVKVIIENKGDAPMDLWDAQTHGLVFAEEGGGKLHVVEHVCQCVEEHRRPESFVIQPKKKVTFILSEWACEGVWTPPPAGKYQLTYRVLSLAQVKPRLTSGEGQEVQDRARVCREPPYESPGFWQGAVSSAPRQVVLRSHHRRKRG